MYRKMTGFYCFHNSPLLQCRIFLSRSLVAIFLLPWYFSVVSTNPSRGTEMWTKLHIIEGTEVLRYVIIGPEAGNIISSSSPKRHRHLHESDLRSWIFQWNLVQSNHTSSTEETSISWFCCNASNICFRNSWLYVTMAVLGGTTMTSMRISKRRQNTFCRVESCLELIKWYYWGINLKLRFPVPHGWSFYVVNPNLLHESGWTAAVEDGF